jgi:putative endonuclease
LGSLQTLFEPVGAFRSAAMGSFGETLAERFLSRKRKFSIVARNWRNPLDRREEIDLVCRDRGALVFVEVKTRADGALVSGYHAVNRRKRKVLRRAIKTYLRLLGSKPRVFRFDVVEVESSGCVRHFENVELFSKHYRP